MAEMADAAQRRADFHAACASHYRAEGFVTLFEEHRRHAEIAQAQADLDRILATDEGRARKFVSGLLQDHAR